VGVAMATAGAPRRFVRGGSSAAAQVEGLLKARRDPPEWRRVVVRAREDQGCSDSRFARWIASHCCRRRSRRRSGRPGVSRGGHEGRAVAVRPSSTELGVHGALGLLFATGQSTPCRTATAARRSRTRPSPRCTSRWPRTAGGACMTAAPTSIYRRISCSASRSSGTLSTRSRGRDSCRASATAAATASPRRP